MVTRETIRVFFATFMFTGVFYVFALPLCADPAPFEYVVIDKDVIGHPQIADIDNDGHEDIILHVHIDKWNIPEPRETMLAWCRWPEYKKHVIFSGDFFGDQVAVGDVNGDGSIDIVSGKQIKKGKVQVFWYQNPLPSGNPQGLWQEHLIGDFKGHLKDIKIGDVNHDQKPDVVARTHESTAIYFQKAKSWQTRIISHPRKEGMALADLDLDGDLDIILNGFWLETPDQPETTGRFLHHNIDKKWYMQKTRKWWDNCCSVGVADINQDGIPDVVLSHSEAVGYPLSWYSVDEISKTKTGPWVEHQIAEQFDWCETVDVGDIDNDGDIDVMAAKFERHDDLNKPPYPVSVFYNTSGDGQSWQRQDLADTGVYAGLLSDVGGDGDLDIVGPHSYYAGPIKMWENQISDKKLSLDKWTYIQVDDARGQWGDWGKPKWLKYFGLDMVDVTGDGFKDIVAGRYFYRNPGGNMTGKWPRVDLGINADGMLFVDVDGDEFGDVIAQALPDVYWFEAKNLQANSWRATKIGTLPPTRHTNGQGYTLAQLIPGGKPEIIMACADGTYYFEVPDNPEAGNWPKTQITNDSDIMDEGIGVGDMNGDGYIDIATGKEVGEDYSVWWFENPRNGSGSWQGRLVGPSDHAPDRIIFADMNGNGLLDVVVSEERYPGKKPDASLYWFEQLSGKGMNFKRHTVTTNKYSLNNLDVTDFDRDGDMDIVTCEHKGPEGKFRLQIFENDSHGSFKEHIIDRGKESHLGTRVADMDNDGDMDIVSIAWDNYKFLHLWRNDSRQGKEK